MFVFVCVCMCVCMCVFSAGGYDDGRQQQVVARGNSRLWEPVPVSCCQDDSHGEQRYFMTHVCTWLFWYNDGSN